MTRRTDDQDDGICRLSMAGGGGMAPPSWESWVMTMSSG
jgi:hypothetical protein